MDAAEILKLDEAGLFTRLSVILEKIRRIDETLPEGESHPLINKLLDEGHLITKCLDPIVRARVGHDPAKLAEWDDIMHSCDDLEESTEEGHASELPR